MSRSNYFKKNLLFILIFVVIFLGTLSTLKQTKNLEKFEDNKLGKDSFVLLQAPNSLAVMNISRTSGMTPFGVLFKGFESTNRDQIVRYTWDFGDGSSVDGFNAGHIYTNPGQYNVSLTVENINGVTHTSHSTINVWSPNGTNYYVDSQIGNDNYDGKCQIVVGNCGPWRNVNKSFYAIMANTVLQPGDQLLFKRGQVFSFAENSLHFNFGNSMGPINIGAYGAGNKPILRYVGPTDASSIINLGWCPPQGCGQARDIRITGLEIYNQNVVYTGVECTSYLQCATGIFAGRSENLLLFDNYIHDVDSVAELTNQTLLFNNAFKNITNTMIWSFTNAPIILVNNTAMDIGLHAAYIGEIIDSVITDNHLGGWAFGRHFRIVGGNNTVILRNYFEGKKDPYNSNNEYPWALVHLGPNIQQDLRGNNIDFSNNILTGCSTCLYIGGGRSNLTISNNLIMPRTKTFDSERIIIGHHAFQASVGNSDIFIYHNTFIEEGRGPALGIVNYGSTSGLPPTNHKNIFFKNNIIVSLNDTSAIAIKIENNQGLINELYSDNNLYYTPNNNPHYFYVSDTGTFYNLSQWRAQFGKDTNSVIGNPAFVNMAGPDGIVGTNDENLRILNTSAAIGIGQILLKMKYDKDSMSRQNGIMGYDVGAYTSQILNTQTYSPASGLIAVALNSTAIQLSWQDNSNTESGFRIERRALPSGTFGFVTNVLSNVVNYVDNGLSASNSYEYRIGAFNSTTGYGWSNLANATTLTNPIPPVAPTLLTITTLSSSSLRANWVDNSNNEDGFVLQYKLSSSPTWQNVPGGVLAANTITFTHNSLSNNTSYDYRIAAYNSAGNSTFATASGTTLQNPAHVYTLTRSPTSGTVQQSGNVQTIVTATYVSGTSSSVSFTASNLSSGVTASFSPTSCTPSVGVPCSVTLTLSASAGATIVSNRQVVITSSSWLSNVNTTYLMNVTSPPICTNGQTQSCPLQQGVCAGSQQICVGNSWPGCNYASIAGYSSIETGVAMCNDGLDNDCDGTRDLGGDSGCPLPQYGSFSQSLTTNFSQVTDFTNVSNLSLGIVNYGRIQFLENVSLWRLNAGVYSAIDISSAISIANNFIRVNSESYPEFNRSARITFYNLTYSEIPAVMMEAASGLVVCPQTRCAILSYNISSGELVVLVSGFSNYTTQATACGDAFCSSSESCSICSQDCGACSVTGGSGGGSSGGSGGGSSGGSSGSSTGSIRSSTQCNDNLDNDGDGKIDYPADSGCLSSQDNVELDETVLGGEEFQEPTETLVPENKNLQIGLVFWFVLTLLAIGIAVIGIIIANYMHKRKKFQEYVKQISKN